MIKRFCGSYVHPVFNPGAAYRYLLPTVYLFIADMWNPDFFVCCCRTWICLDITLLYEEQRQSSSQSAWPTYSQNGKSGRHCWGGDFDSICTAACQNRCDCFTACRLWRLEPVDLRQFGYQRVIKHIITLEFIIIYIVKC